MLNCGNEMSSVDISCRTEIKAVRLRYKWTIGNFSRCYKTVGEFFTSSTFWAEEAPDIKWNLQLYPRGIKVVKKSITSKSVFDSSSAPKSIFAFGNTDVDDNSIQVGSSSAAKLVPGTEVLPKVLAGASSASTGPLAKNSTTTPQRVPFETPSLTAITFTPPSYCYHCALVKLNLLQCKSNKILAKHSLSFISNIDDLVPIALEKEEAFVTGSTVEINTDKLMYELLAERYRYMSRDDLAIFCELTITCESVEECHEFKPIQFGDIEVTLIDDLSELMEKGDFSDVTLVVEGREIPAHKNILAARSPVFAAMFKNELKENQTNTVDIADMSYESVSEMIRYIYTGRTGKSMIGVATDLIAAADKYDLQGLFALCEKALNKNLKVETVADILVLANMHGLQCLKQRAIDFIDEHTEEVRKTEGWKIVIEKHPHLIIEAFLFKPPTRKPL